MKKYISLFLAMVMIIVTFAGFGEGVFADELVYSWQSGSTQADFDSTTGVLTISGTGDMADYTVKEPAPWAANDKYTVKSVMINSGVTNIGARSFSNMYHLVDVEIPDTVTSIGERAFSGSRFIERIDIPASVTSIGNAAFRTASATIKSELTAINVDSANEYFTSENGVLYDKSKTVLYQVPCALPATELVIPDSVETIKDQAGISCINLEKITIGSGAKTIGASAFANCSKLTDIYFNSKTVVLGATTVSKNSRLTIHGYTGSSAYNYANSNSIAFENFPVISFVYSNASIFANEYPVGTSAQMIEIPDNSPVASNDDGTHLVYHWAPEIVDVTDDAVYTEISESQECSYTDFSVLAAPTCKDEGIKSAECTVCGHVKTEAIAPLGVNITIDAAELGRVTLDDEDVTGRTINVPYDTDVTLVATANDNAHFLGWKANDVNIISDAEELFVKAVADVTYTPVFAETTVSNFTVTFVDMFGNVIKQQTVNSSDEISEPAAPDFVGYTFDKWSVDPSTVTKATTITALYTKNDTESFTVKADGCTIKCNGNVGTNEMTGLTFNSMVTVTVSGATSWKINGAAVAYGETYTFYIGSDVELQPVFDKSVVATPTVSKVSTDRVEGKCDVIFLATRSMTDNCTYINAGFVYGKNLNDTDLRLENVGKKGTNENSGNVKAVYCATDAKQFILRYGILAQTGTASARAFLIYLDAEGDTQIIYAAPQSYKY